MAFGTAVASFFGGQAASAGGQTFGGYSRAFSYAGNMLVQNNSLGFESYLRMFNLRTMSKEVFRNQAAALGFKIPDLPAERYDMFVSRQDGLLVSNRTIWTAPHTEVSRAVAMSKQFPSPDEVLLLYNRGLIGQATALWMLRLNFGGEPDLARSWLTLADQIPGPSDLIAFAVRDCFDPNIVTTFQYNKELPSAILPWMKKQGLGGILDLPMPPGSTNTEGNDARSNPSWFDLYWWSHWQLPSVGQGYEMLQRLYPNSLYGPSPYASESTYFSQQNLELLQKANDFPPFWRERLQAIAYHPLGRIDIRRMHEVGILKEDKTNHDVFHAYKQIGYDDTNAQRLTDYVILRSRKDIVNPTVSQLDKLYLQGALEYEDAKEKLIKLYYPPEQAEAHLQNLNLQLQSENIAAALKAVRRAFIAGDIDVDTATNSLLRVGVISVRVHDYLARWTIERNNVFRYVSVERAIKLFRTGYINEGMLRQRLTNLRYVDLDINLLVQEAKNEYATQQYKQTLANIKTAQKQADTLAKAKAKTAQSTAKQLTANAKAIARERETLTKKDLAAYTDKNIIAFFKGGFIDWAGVDRVLAAKGWTPATIIRWKDTFLAPLTTEKANAPKA